MTPRFWPRKDAKGWYHSARNGILTRGTAAKDLRTTALHEAAHAVIAHRLGHKVQRLWIESLPKRGLRNTRGYTETCYKTRNRRPDAFAVVVVALAGHEAEHMVYGRPITALPMSDLRDIYRCGVATSQSLNLAGWISRKCVRRDMKAIRRVAVALRVRGSLNRRQFLAVIRLPR